MDQIEAGVVRDKHGIDPRYCDGRGSPNIRIPEIRATGWQVGYSCTKYETGGQR